MRTDTGACLCTHDKPRSWSSVYWLADIMDRLKRASPSWLSSQHSELSSDDSACRELEALSFSSLLKAACVCFEEVL